MGATRTSGTSPGPAGYLLCQQKRRSLDRHEGWWGRRTVAAFPARVGGSRAVSSVDLVSPLWVAILWMIVFLFKLF